MLGNAKHTRRERPQSGDHCGSNASKGPGLVPFMGEVRPQTLALDETFHGKLVHNETSFRWVQGRANLRGANGGSVAPFRVGYSPFRQPPLLMPAILLPRS